MKQLFQNKNYVLLFFGFLVSELGNVIFGFAAGLYIADLTGRASMLGIFMALGAGVRIVMSPLAGALVDRWNKIKIIYMTDYIRGIIFAITAYLFWGGLNQQEATIILLIGVALSGFIGAFFFPAVSSATPEIVGMDQLQAANGANSIVNSITGIVGVLIGIVAFTLFSFEVAVLINAISFLLSGFSEMFIKAHYKEDVVPEESSGMWKDMQFGFRYMKKTEGFTTFIMYILFLNFAVAPIFNVGIPSLMRIQLQRSAWEIGWVNIAFSLAMMVAGVVIGSMTIHNYKKTIRTNLSRMVIVFILMAFLIFLLDINIISYWLFYGLFIVVNILIAFTMIGTNVPLNTGLVKIVEPQFRGRVFATISAFAQGLTPIAILLGGFIVDATSVSFLAVVCAMLLVIPTVGFVRHPGVTALLDTIDGTSVKAEEMATSTI